MIQILNFLKLKIKYNIKLKEDGGGGKRRRRRSEVKSRYDIPG
jgi:hypothetical protein